MHSVPSEIEGGGEIKFFHIQNTTYRYIYIYCILFIYFSPLNYVGMCLDFQVQVAIIW